MADQSRKLRIPLRIVFYRDEDAVVAHCLEFDLMGDGATREEAARRLLDAIVLQAGASVEHGNPHNLFRPAAGRFFEMFAAGTDVTVGELRLEAIDSLVIDGIEAREYAGADADSGAQLITG